MSEREITHTPGPWRVGSYGTTVMTGRPNALANDTICSVYRPQHSGIGLLVLSENDSLSQMEANACLIAAAPELLEACKKAAKANEMYICPACHAAASYSDWTAHEDHTCVTCHEAEYERRYWIGDAGVEAARAAIAKAQVRE